MFIHLNRVPAVTDGRTDRETDGITLAITALCIASMRPRCKKFNYLDGSRPGAFQRAIYEVRTLTQSPPKQ